tara:strand:+ start:471 stop:923 length:453 start_codon:yes stop_codon:yes gene_type:complete
MSLKLKIEEEIKTAMLQKNKDRLRALRAIKSMILIAETEKGAATVLSEESEVKILSRAAKQRRDSLTVYQDQGRKDLAEIERDELQVIETFLPQQLNAEELETAVREIIERIGAISPKDMGKVMGMASKELSGKVDGKALSSLVKSLLMG